MKIGHTAAPNSRATIWSFAAALLALGSLPGKAEPGKAENQEPAKPPQPKAEQPATEQPKAEPGPHQQALQNAPNLPLLLLDSSAKVWSLHVTSGGRLTVKKGDVMINSSHQHALWAADGTIEATAGSISVAGGVNRLGRPVVKPEPRTGAEMVQDPFPQFRVPVPEREVSQQRLNLNQDGDVTLYPGIYTGGIWATARNLRLKMMPGVYIINGGDFSIFHGQVWGDGVTIVMSGQDPGAFSTNFGAQLHLSAPTEGMLEGLVLISRAKGWNKIALSDTQAKLNGTIYAPEAEMAVSGQKSLLQVPRVVCSSLSLVLSAAMEVTGDDAAPVDAGKPQENDAATAQQDEMPANFKH